MKRPVTVATSFREPMRNARPIIEQESMILRSADVRICLYLSLLVEGEKE
jgi:hypothetical protein